VSFRTKCAILINECNLCTITRDYSFRPLRGLIQDMAVYFIIYSLSKHFCIRRRCLLLIPDSELWGQRGDQSV